MREIQIGGGLAAICHWVTMASRFIYLSKFSLPNVPPLIFYNSYRDKGKEIGIPCLHAQRDKGRTRGRNKFQPLYPSGG